MPFWSQDRPGPPGHNEQQRLLRDSGLPSYSAMDGASAAGHWDRDDAMDDQPEQAPPQYMPGPPSLETGAANRRLSCRTGGWYLFMFILGGLIAWIIQDLRTTSILNPAELEKRRLGWDRDYTEHLSQVSTMQNITVKWAQELEQHASIREAMRKEREQWDKEHALAHEAIRKEREEWDKEYASAREGLRKERDEWNQEYASAREGMRKEREEWDEEYALAREGLRKEREEWDKEYVSAREGMRKEREAWDKEHASGQEAIRKEREEWDKERAQWEIERREHERLREERMKLDLEKRRRKQEREKEDDEMRRAGLRWQNPQPDEHCLRLGTRRYTAKLENLPEGFNRMKACHDTRAWINGRWVFPTQCDDGGLWGGVIGSWIVDWDEAGCRTFFQDFKDKGCTAQGSGRRRIESQLENLRYGDDGMRMCSSTPADFHGLHFEAPDSCVYWGKYGYWGLWFIEDGSCA